MYELSWCNVGDEKLKVQILFRCLFQGKRLKITDPINLKKFF